MNLTIDPAPSGQFDLVLCRNVMLYFAPDPRNEPFVPLRARCGIQAC